MITSWHRGERVSVVGKTGTVAHVEADGTVWVVWPPEVGNPRYSAGGYRPSDLDRLDPPMCQITLEME